MQFKDTQFKSTYAEKVSLIYIHILEIHTAENSEAYSQYFVVLMCRHLVVKSNNTNPTVVNKFVRKNGYLASTSKQVLIVVSSRHFNAPVERWIV